MRRELKGVLRDRFRLQASSENDDRRYGKRISPGEAATVARVRSSWPIEIVDEHGHATSLEQVWAEAQLFGKSVCVVISTEPPEPRAPSDRPTDPDPWPHGRD